MSLTATLVTAALASAGSSAASDDRNQLTHQKATVTQRLASSHADLDEISKRLLTAQGSLDAASGRLDAARSQLASTQLEVSVAAAKDAVMQTRLVASQAQLAAAQSQLAAGIRAVARQRATLVGYAVSSSASQLAQLSTLNLLFSDGTTQQAISAIQGTNDAMNRQVTDFQRLQAQEALLRYTEQRVHRDELQVAAARRASAATLANTRVLEGQAATQETSVADQLTAIQHTRDSLASAKQAELAKIHAMQAEQAAIATKLKRIAEQEAAAHHATMEPGAAAPSDGGYLSYPVHDTYITSPYGMRMNPVIHVYELHDGTDFHAVCGTPVYAAAPGTVSQEYWNDAYGNRLFIDHGYVHGVSLMTSYNHLTSYVAHVGERVARGQLVAYSGTTGWSTGCHLHFSVYVNGTTVNPVSWL
jgi:murein DD-endopeptidase MepM/ murein hydrolase activator NlpD